MKKYIETDNGRIYKLEGLMFISEIKEKYLTYITVDTKFDKDGNPLPIFYFEMKYDNDRVVESTYDDLEEADQDRGQIIEELNRES